MLVHEEGRRLQLRARILVVRDDAGAEDVGALRVRRRAGAVGSWRSDSTCSERAAAVRGALSRHSLKLVQLAFRSEQAPCAGCCRHEGSSVFEWAVVESHATRALRAPSFAPKS